MKVSKKLKFIDAARGYAILGVIMIHTLKIVQPTNIYLSILANKGKYGVQLFFLASAFTLFLSLDRRTEKNSRNFFIRRFFRIAPMYYMGILFYLFVFKEVSNSYNGNLIYCEDSVISFFNIFSNFIFINSTNPSWCSTIVPGGATISVEMIFYLIVPFLYSKINTLDSAVKFLLASIFLSFILSILLNNFLVTECNELKNIFMYSYFFKQLPVFSLGIIAFFIIVKEDFKLKKNTFLFLFLLVFIYAIWNMIITKFLLVSFTALLFLIALSKTHSKILVNDFISFIGKVSYSAYLIHFIVIYYLDMVLLRFNFPLKFVPYFIITVVVTLLASNIFRHLVENPFIRVGKYFIKKPNENIL